MPLISDYEQAAGPDQHENHPMYFYKIVSSFPKNDLFLFSPRFSIGLDIDLVEK